MILVNLNFSNGISFILRCFSAAVSVDVTELKSPILFPTVYDCLSFLRARTLRALTCVQLPLLLFSFAL